MESLGYRYIVKARVMLTGPELAILWRCSRAHYDCLCKRASDLATMNTYRDDCFLALEINGAFNEQKNFPKKWVEKDILSLSPVEVELGDRQLQTLCKCLEVADYACPQEFFLESRRLTTALYKIGRERSDEHVAKNPDLYVEAPAPKRRKQ